MLCSLPFARTLVTPLLSAHDPAGRRYAALKQMNADTGEAECACQFTPHDQRGHDGVNETLQGDMKINGVMRSRRRPR